MLVWGVHGVYMNNAKEKGFPSLSKLREFVKAHEAKERCVREMDLAMEPKDAEASKVSQRFLNALRGAALEGFPSKEKPTFEVKLEEGGYNGGPVMTESVFEDFVRRQRTKKPSGVSITWEDFLELSPRERGTLWAPIKVTLEMLQVAGYKVVEIRVTMEDGFTDRSWVYPATVVIGKA